MKTLCLIAISLLTLTAHGQLTGLPLHFEQKTDADLLYAGPFQITEGEQVSWVYPFQWAKFDKQGARSIIQKSERFLFEGVDAQGRWKVVAADGNRYAIPLPPNNVGARSCFDLTTMKVAKGLDSAIILNRLGDPQQVEQLKGEGEAWIYTNSVELKREGTDTITKNTDGYIGDLGFGATSTTEIPFAEKRVYSPYCFAVKVVDGKVTGVVDAWKPSPGWQASR